MKIIKRFFMLLLCMEKTVVRYILNTPEHELFINEKDKNGNTPLHLATINWHPKVESSLTWDKRVVPMLVNIDGLTALEAAEENMEAMTSYRQGIEESASFLSDHMSKDGSLIFSEARNHLHSYLII